MMFRLAGGKTVNRPEFREVSPFAFFDFENNVTVYGNPEVRNSYITNMDGRFEWYPTSEEIVSLGVFYKHFEDPIESKILHTGSGWNYTFHNAEKAQSYGLEFDARKRLHEFEKSTNLKFLSNITLVVNASIIQSIVATDSIAEGESQRVLQGQSPYIVNVGLYYNDTKNGIMGSAMFNKAGKRIAVVGDINTPHIWEMPFNSLDFTFEKKIFEKISIKFGIKNALDGDVIFQQFQKYKTPAGDAAIREQVTNKFKPGRQFKLGVSVTL
jgi:outer membrane receptor protein involved in Fe transport